MTKHVTVARHSLPVGFEAHYAKMWSALRKAEKPCAKQKVDRPALPDGRKRYIEALRALSPATVAMIADECGVNNGSAANGLVRLEKAGLAMRERGGRVNGRNAPDIWRITALGMKS